MKPISYPVPWDRVAGLTPHIARGSRENIDDFTASIVARMDPPPVVEGLERLPASARFVLVANHYQRKGLWILHTAAAITQAIRRQYGPGDPPVRWMVTANWPPVRLGSFTFPSPGDWVLPKVAHALHCYPVSFAGANPAFTAQSIRRILKDAATVERPIGIFPEGVAGSAGQLTDPLPGVDRLVAQLAKKGMPAVPVGVSEAGRFVLRFGTAAAPEEILGSTDPARLLMDRIAQLIR